MNNDPRLQIILNHRQRQRAKQGKGQAFIRVVGIGVISIVVAIGLFFSLTVGGAVAAYLPNRFPDAGSEPEFNAVDASLWYVVAVHDFLVECERRGRAVDEQDRRALVAAVERDPRRL